MYPSIYLLRTCPATTALSPTQLSRLLLSAKQRAFGNLVNLITRRGATPAETAGDKQNHERIRSVMAGGSGAGIVKVIVGLPCQQTRYLSCGGCMPIDGFYR